MRGKLGFCFSILLAAGLLSAAARAADWPQYRADAARSGSTSEKLPAKPALAWTYKAMHPPAPAWPGDDRMVFDRAFQPVIAGGTLYFGSSADGAVRALDAATGKERWVFFTEGPVRFAPAVSKGRVLVASDDGYLYCLAAKDGKLLWKKRGGPRDDMVLGNGRMISRWPARGGPIVVGEIVYFAAGIWPAEGVYLHALNASSGKTIWSNDGLGLIVRGHPHQMGKKIPAGIGVQGYLAASAELLMVPTGRSTPAAHEPGTGKLKYFHAAKSVGGAGVVIIDKLFFNGRNAYGLADGAFAFGSTRKHINTSRAPVAATSNLIFRAGAKGLEVIDRAKPFVKKGSGKKVTTTANIRKTLRAPCAGEIITAGGTVYCGGKGQVAAVDGKTLAVTWTADVKGTVYGLAAAGGRLYVSTDAGNIYCFGARSGGNVSPKKTESPYGAGGSFAAAAAEIIKKTGIRQGYCVDLGCGSGQLAFEIAKRSELFVIGIEKDPARVAAARKKLAAAGLYGVRVTIHQGNPARTSYISKFANLVVSGNALAGGAFPEKEAARLQRPWGGAICAGKPGAMTPKLRGALKGAGSWTHLYANAANTGASADVLVKAPLAMRWFGGPQLDIPSRHGRPPGPLYYQGRLFAMGLQAVSAVDAYNGGFLWKFDIPDVGKMYTRRKLPGSGMATDGSPYCVAPEGLFVRTGGKCLRLDPATGKKLGEFPAPKRPDGKTSRWGYIACEGGLLFGSITDDEHIVVYKDTRSESISLFAMDAKSGKVKWSYKPKHSVRQNAIAVGGGRLYLIDRPKADFDLRTARKRKGVQPPGELVALEAASGKELWRVGNVRGTMLVLSLKNKVLLACTQSSGYSLYSERSGKLAIYEMSSGKLLREITPKYYRSRPLIIGGEVHAEPYAYDLASGKKTGFSYSRIHGCGIVSGAPNILLFRTGPLGFADLSSGKTGKSAVQFYGGTRPGCWVYAIAAGGMVLLPNSFNVCSCSYLNRTNVALEPVEKR
jgi:outer membrane protein assembly factor BamB